MAYLEYRPTQTLFQYTSVDGFFGILKSKKLWLSDLRTANDPRELKLGHERLIQGIRTVLGNGHREVNLEGLERLTEHLTGYFDRIQAFCCCFSLAPDELPMWAAYGQNYSGLAFGFRPAAILAVPGRVQQVQYLDVSNGNKAFEELALDIAAGLEPYRNSSDIVPWVLAGARAAAAVTTLKHQSWAYEKEVRVVYSQLRERPEGVVAQYPATQMPDGKALYWREPLKRKAGARSIDYVEFPFGRFRDGNIDPARAIKTIIMGPNCPLSVAAVEAELTKHGFRDCIVQKSDCHIRV